jgi:hypothetical protein
MFKRLPVVSLFMWGQQINNNQQRLQSLLDVMILDRSRHR